MSRASRRRSRPAAVRSSSRRTAADASAYVVDVCRRPARSSRRSRSRWCRRRSDSTTRSRRPACAPVETDLGEYLLQLAGEHPVHIIAPAIEKTAEDVAELLSRVEGTPVPAELGPLTPGGPPTAPRDLPDRRRRHHGCELRRRPRPARSVLVTNEGNGRLVSALPRVHVAIMGMERLVADLDDLSVLLRLLARSGTGQKLSTLHDADHGTSAGRRAGRPRGAARGDRRQRSLEPARNALRGDARLHPLRACLNVCPVYRKTGGAAYGPVYSGPMGAVLVPLLVGLDQAPSLPHASSLCGACTDACPVKIPLARAAARAARDLVEGNGYVAARAARVHALVARLVVSASATG